MNTQWTCFLFGIPTTLFWARGLLKGAMLGGRSVIWVRREAMPGMFWFLGAIYGMIALGLLASPLFSRFGFRG